MAMKKSFGTKAFLKKKDYKIVKVRSLASRNFRISEKVKKKILAASCAVCLMFSLLLDVFALSSVATDIQSAEQVINLYSTNQEIKYSISSQKTILGISGNSTYTIYKLKPFGFAILLDETNGLMEACYAENAIVPIDMKSDAQYYYGGPGVYCIRQNGSFLNTFDGEFLSFDDVYYCGQLERSASQYELRKSGKIDSKAKFTMTRSDFSTHTVANNYFAFLDEYGENEHGTCTVIAAAMLLGYYDNFIDENFVPTQYEEGNGTSEAFHQLLNGYVYGTSALGGIFIHEALPGINAYLTDQTVWARMVSDNSSQTSIINNIIDNLAGGDPVIASMGTHLGATYDHTVLIYSVTYYNDDPAGTAAVRMNMGWGDTINDSGQYNTAYVTTAGWFYECGYLEYA